MLNIRLEEGDIQRIMAIALELQNRRKDYRLGAATVIEAILKRAMESPDLMREFFSDEVIGTPIAAESKQERTHPKGKTARQG